MSTTHENHVRRIAARQGLQLTKSPARDPQSPDYGTYGLLTVDGHHLVAGSHQTGYGLSLDDVEEELEARRR
ncbi:hypothetical protein [Rhodococcus sp. LB1]|uniref:hypothetical protein n=1 Tax=Rhodococcus sp. LB1 TaxID=1807499 RepID=UPI00077AAF72|nr:hypothetical protein [Rhodococcus sp. LB1]KXX59712.1 hypothetical protein AZG88_06755 [Rhodococcus sp. LB1]